MQPIDVSVTFFIYIQILHLQLTIHTQQSLIQQCLQFHLLMMLCQVLSLTSRCVLHKQLPEVAMYSHI